MGMFDWYRPARKIACPVCAHPLTKWQSKEGPCGLFVWQEGSKHPVDQPIAEESRLPPPKLSKFTLPESFYIHSYDCPQHHPIDARCQTREGVWRTTELLPFEPDLAKRRELL